MQQRKLGRVMAPPSNTWAVAWPAITAATNAVKIRYLAGYDIDSDGGEALPKMIRAAVLLVVGHLYANREASTEVALTHIPLGVESLLRQRHAGHHLQGRPQRLRGDGAVRQRSA